MELIDENDIDNHDVFTPVDPSILALMNDQYNFEEAFDDTSTDHSNEQYICSFTKTPPSHENNVLDQLDCYDFEMNFDATRDHDSTPIIICSVNNNDFNQPPIHDPRHALESPSENQHTATRD